MDWQKELFPPDYWKETREMPPLQITAPSHCAAFRILRCYLNQEGRITARPVETLDDEESARHTLGQLTAQLERGLRSLRPESGHAREL